MDLPSGSADADEDAFSINHNQMEEHTTAIVTQMAKWKMDQCTVMRNTRRRQVTMVLTAAAVSPSSSI